MKPDLQFEDAKSFSQHLRRLQEQRGQQKKKTSEAGHTRHSPTKKQREEILNKTHGRCHICGGEIATDEPWEADHVLAHAQGGNPSVSNYLPAHSTCNKYRWFYGPEEFQWILKLGVWMRTLIDKQDPQVLKQAERFVKKEKVRITRQK